MSEWVWTWGGVSFGWINDDALFTQGGRHVGRVEYDGDETLAFSIVDGRYLGEVRDGNRLITKESRVGRRRGPRSERMPRTPRMPRMDRMPRMMRMGCCDFPEPQFLEGAGALSSR
jgi:hypothetical protein